MEKLLVVCEFEHWMKQVADKGIELTLSSNFGGFFDSC